MITKELELILGQDEIEEMRHELIILRKEIARLVVDLERVKKRDASNCRKNIHLMKLVDEMRAKGEA